MRVIYIYILRYSSLLLIGCHLFCCGSSCYTNDDMGHLLRAPGYMVPFSWQVDPRLAAKQVHYNLGWSIAVPLSRMIELLCQIVPLQHNRRGYNTVVSLAGRWKTLRQWLGKVCIYNEERYADCIVVDAKARGNRIPAVAEMSRTQAVNWGPSLGSEGVKKRPLH